MHPRWELPLDARGMDIDLDGGTVIRIRPVRSDDRDVLMAAFERLSAQSRYHRFFSPMPKLTESLARSLTEVDHHRHLAWAVFDPNRPSEVADESGLAVASARIIADMDAPGEAEAALGVVDEYQHQGIGRFLVELLVATAAQHDIHTLRFDVLRENAAMVGLLEGLGATGQPAVDEPGVVTYDLTVPPIDDIDLAAGAIYVLLRRIAQEDPAD